MFKVYLSNFHYYLPQTLDTLEEAIKLGRDKGFAFCVYRADNSFVGYCDGVNLSWHPYTYTPALI